MWAAELSDTSEILDYEIFGDMSGFGMYAETMDELVTKIRNYEDGYEGKPHLKKVSGDDGVRYILTIKSNRRKGCVDFKLYDLTNLEGCNEEKKRDFPTANCFGIIINCYEQKEILNHKLRHLKEEYTKALMEYQSLRGVNK